MKNKSAIVKLFDTAAVVGVQDEPVPLLKTPPPFVLGYDLVAKKL